MTSGNELKFGNINKFNLNEDEMWGHFQFFIYFSNKTMSYKFVFFRSILENLSKVNENYEISFADLFYMFTKFYWNLIGTHKLYQSNSKNQQSGVQLEIEKFIKEKDIPSDFNFDYIPVDKRNHLVKQIKKIGKRYVIGALYEDFSGNLFEFHKRDEYFKLNPKYYEFLQRHKRILNDLTNYQLVLFLEKNNDEHRINYLLTTLELLNKRKSLEEFKKILLQYGNQQCFYCKKSIKQCTVDHFIPWTYMQSDDLWNFVIACKSCNSSKNNKIASELYLDSIKKRNRMLVCESSLSDYFETYTEQKITTFYNYSTQNGFQSDWSPK